MLTSELCQLKEFERLAPRGANNSTKELETVTSMWATQPAYTEAELRAIDISVGRRTWIVDADRDEGWYRPYILLDSL